MQKRASLILIALLVTISMVLCGCENVMDNKTGSSKSKVSQKQDDAKIDPALAKLMKAGSQIKGMYYEITMTAMNKTTSMKVWQQENKIRTEMTFANIEMVMIFNPDKDLFCSYMPATNTAATLDAGAKASMKSSLANRWSLDEASDYKVVGSENCNGFACKVIEGKQDGDKVKMWIREDLGLPVKCEVISAGKTMTMEFKNYKIGTQPDKYFELPPGVRIAQTTIPPMNP